MAPKEKTKKELLLELTKMRQRVDMLLAVETARKRDEESSQESKERYQFLAENINDIIYSANTDGILTFVSPQVERYGIKPEEMVSKCMLDFVIPGDREKVMQDLERSVITGEEFPTEFRIQDHHGNFHWMEDHGRMIRDENGNIIGVSGVLHDITDRKRAEEELQAYQDELEEIVAERTTDLEKTNEYLKQEIGERQQVEQSLRTISQSAIDFMQLTFDEDIFEFIAEFFGNVGKLQFFPCELLKVLLNRHHTIMVVILLFDHILFKVVSKRSFADLLFFQMFYLKVAVNLSLIQFVLTT